MTQSLKTSMTEIELIQLGDTYPVNFNKIQKFGNNSKIFNISAISENSNDQILNKIDTIQLFDTDFKSFKIQQTTDGFSVVIVNRPLEKNYFTRRITEHLIVISIFNIEALNFHEGISLEMYIIRFLLAFSTIFQTYKNLPESTDLMQHNTTGCLFDKCIYKPQIATFFREPKLSSNVISFLSEKTLPYNFLHDLQNEIKKLKIKNYYKLKDWIEESPIKTIAFTFLIGLIFSDLLGNYIYDLIHNYLPFINNN